jgi:transposase
MTGVDLESFVKANLTDEEVDNLFNLGPEAVRWAILEFSARLGLYEKKDVSAPDANVPSGQIPVYKKPNRESRRRKKPGRKNGHPGARREVPERVDEEIIHTRQKCPDCGGPLGEPRGQRFRITEDLPEVRPVVRKHFISRYKCGKCGKLVDAPVTSALPKSVIGNNALALTGWMHYGLGTTIKQIEEVLHAHMRFKITAGGLVKMWHRLAAILEEWYGQIALEARSSAVLHIDETGWRVNGKTNWLWCFTNERLTFYIIDRSRGSPALKKFMGETFGGTLITDFWSAYNSIACDKRQYCLAHLFRELDKVDGHNDSDEWKRFRKKLTRILRDAVRLDSADGIDDEKWESRAARLHDRLSGIRDDDWTDPDVVRLCKRLEKYEHGILTFLYDENVHHTNNHAEREIRPAVVMRKVIQQNRSDKGAHTQEVLMSVYRTLKLRGQDPIKTIVSALSDYLITGKLTPLAELYDTDG